MSDEQPVSIPTTRGSEHEIMTELWHLSLTDMDPIQVATAVRSIQQGDRVVELCGERFEVVDPEWDIVQDVYGCERGRDCTDATAADRVRFEVMIAARTKVEG